jgi:hypothetical protein
VLFIRLTMLVLLMTKFSHSRFGRLTIQQLEQRRLIGRKFLQRLTIDPRNDAGDQQVDWLSR